MDDKEFIKKCREEIASGDIPHIGDFLKMTEELLLRLDKAADVIEGLKTETSYLYSEIDRLEYHG